MEIHLQDEQIVTLHTVANAYRGKSVKNNPFDYHLERALSALEAYIQEIPIQRKKELISSESLLYTPWSAASDMVKNEIKEYLHERKDDKPLKLRTNVREIFGVRIGDMTIKRILDVV